MANEQAATLEAPSSPKISRAGSKDDYPEMPNISDHEKRLKSAEMGRELTHLDVFLMGAEKNLEKLERDKKAAEQREGKVIIPSRKENIRQTSDVDNKGWKDEDWRKFNWEKDDAINVAEKLIAVTKEVDTQIEDGNIRNALELFIVKGFSPKDVIEKLDKIFTQAKARGEGGYRSFDGVAVAFEKEFGIHQDDVRRFLLPKMFADRLQSAYSFDSIKSIEDWAWIIMYNDETDWGLNGKNPLLRARVKLNEKGEIEREGKKGKVIAGGYYIDTTNMHRWLRSREMLRYAEDRDNPRDFFSLVDYQKGGNNIPIGQAFNQLQLFRTRDNKQHYDDLYNVFLREIWAFTELRNRDPKIREVEGSDKEFAERFKQLSYGNTFTKETYKKNLLNYMVTMPLHVEERTSGGELMNYDNKFGAAWVHAFMIYYNIDDLEKLQEILGEDSEFFTQKGFLRAAQTVMDKEKANTGRTDFATFFGHDTQELFLKAYDKNGKIKNDEKSREAFRKLLNVFPNFSKPEKVELILRQMVQNSIEEIYQFGEEDINSLEMAEVWAWSWLVYAGVTARADKDTGYNSLSKILNSFEYRSKMFQRGNSTGNPATVHLFKSFGEDFFSSIRTRKYREIYQKDNRGNVVRDKEGRPIIVDRHYDTILEVFDDLAKINLERATRRKLLVDEKRIIADDLKEAKKVSQDSPEVKTLKKRLADITTQIEEFGKEEHKEKYTARASDLEFSTNAEKNYANNFLERGFKLYNDVVAAEQSLEFEKFVDRSVYGVRFKRKEFQEKVQEQIGRQVRYFLWSYGEHDFSKLVRDRLTTDTIIDGVVKRAGEWATMPLGEAMFGHQIVDYPEFWKTEKVGAKKSRYVIDNNGRHVIDWHKVNTPEGGNLLYKRYMLARIGADIIAHKTRSFSDPDIEVSMLTNVIDALESIPGELFANEYEAHRTMIPKGSFFNKKDINWLKDFARVRQWNLIIPSLMQTFWGKHGKGLGIVDTITKFLREAFSSFQSN